jgi:flagella basal body P-ring formation protein FlgA
MSKLRLAALAFTLALAAIGQPGPGQADTIAYLPDGQSLTLRERIMVDDDVVRLGDLFQEQLSDADVAVAQAPKPGQSLALDARFLQQMARAYRLDWKPTSRYQKVMIGRMSQRVTAAMVRDALAAAVQARIGSASDLDVALDGGDLEFDLPTDVDNSVTVSAINFDPVSNRFAAVLVAPADGPPLFQRNVFGTVFEMAQVPVPTRLISAGEVVMAADIEWRAVQFSRLSNNTLTDSQQVIGYMAKRPLKVGQVLRQSDVVMAPAMKKNDLVRIVVHTGQMTLTVQGKVMQDAAIGQSVRVLNVASNRQLSGTVVDAGTVAVGFDVPTISNPAIN